MATQRLCLILYYINPLLPPKCIFFPYTTSCTLIYTIVETLLPLLLFLSCGVFRMTKYLLVQSLPRFVPSQFCFCPRLHLCRVPRSSFPLTSVTLGCVYTSPTYTNHTPSPSSECPTRILPRPCPMMYSATPPRN